MRNSLSSASHSTAVKFHDGFPLDVHEYFIQTPQIVLHSTCAPTWPIRPCHNVDA